MIYRTMLAAGLLAMTLPIAAVSAATPDRCTIRALRATTGQGAAESHAEKGETFTANQFNVDRLTGENTYCTTGGECFPTAAFETVTPCHLSPYPTNNASHKPALKEVDIQFKLD